MVPREGFQLVVVANRLPVHLREPGDQSWLPSPGGLVSALTQVLQAHAGLWIGWPGVTESCEHPTDFEGIALESVQISREEYEDFYLGFSNATLWPLYHDAIRSPSFQRRWWDAYVAVNERFAEVTARHAAIGATVWIHDYQLQLVPDLLRRRRPDLRIGFFLHIPFPPIELFMQLPWRRRIVEGLLGADLIGFQEPHAASNFSRIARRLGGVTGTDARLDRAGRTMRVGAYPISIDIARITRLVESSEVRARAIQIRSELGNPEVVLLGVDRLDYTKGIQHRISALAELYADGVLEAGRHVVVQVAVPSRESDPHYDRERRLLEQAVSEVNGEHGHVGRPAVHYLHQNMPIEELVALYLAADVMLVTPLRDGMNLVAKEYIACRADLTGRLVLSEFAGAATELRAAYLVNPHDLDELKDTITTAISADPKAARRRMSRLRRQVARRDVYKWADEFLADLGTTSQQRDELRQGSDDDVGDGLRLAHLLESGHA
ncbi:MAG: alpha,alpha-trehalose-phosphate synthase (UDP-forming) [Acidimicrobiales bacterium]